MKQLTDLIAAHIDAGHSFMLLADARNYMYVEPGSGKVTRYEKGKPVEELDAVKNEQLAEYGEFRSMAPRSFQLEIYPEYKHLMPVPQPNYDGMGRVIPD